nr:uncharacterized protein LOC109185225 [Ipomoea trifida]
MLCFHGKSRTMMTPQTVGFRIGDAVEVTSNEEGFVGSYYEATIVGQLTTGDAYVVEYKNLVTDDFSAPLTENVPLVQIRPQPLQVQSTFFDMYQVVDAFDNDGWWVGQITGEYRNSYYVYFEHYGKRVCYGVGAFSYLPMHSGIHGEIRISSSYYATRVLFNYECPEVFAFKDRFLTPIRTISSRSRNTGSGSLETMSNENITMTSLMDIYDDKKVGEFWVVGEITDIQPDWYFIACANKGCGKKIQEINEQMYCKSCDIQSPDEIIKYKLVIDVLDDEQDGQLILWDNVCSPLLGFTASELKGKYSEEGCMPNEIEGLIGKTMKFMIVTREDQFRVCLETRKMISGNHFPGFCHFTPFVPPSINTKNAPPSTPKTQKENLQRLRPSPEIHLVVAVDLPVAATRAASPESRGLHWTAWRFIPSICLSLPHELLRRKVGDSTGLLAGSTAALPRFAIIVRRRRCFAQIRPCVPYSLLL